MTANIFFRPEQSDSESDSQARPNSGPNIFLLVVACAGLSAYALGFGLVGWLFMSVL